MKILLWGDVTGWKFIYLFYNMKPYYRPQHSAYDVIYYIIMSFAKSSIITIILRAFLLNLKIPYFVVHSLIVIWIYLGVHAVEHSMEMIL